MKFHAPFPRHNQTQFIQVDTALCQACWKCVEVCPQSVLGKTPLRRHQHVHVDQASLCRGCQKCVRICPQGAIHPIQKSPQTFKATGASKATP